MRLWGLGFGLPELFHPDEPAYVLQALAVGRGLPNGLTFADPPLFKYLLLGEFSGVYGLDRVTGSVHSQQEFVEQFRADPTLLYLLARTTSALVGALTVVVTGALGAAVGGRRVGLLAMVLAAGTFVLVRESHFGVDDAFLTLLVTVGLVACAQRKVILAGAIGGLAFAAKYDGIALLVPVALQARTARRLAVALGVCALVAVLTFPSLVSEPGRVLGDIYTHLYLSSTSGYDGLDPEGGYLFYARALGTGLGWPLVIAALAGIGLSVARRNWLSLVVVSFPVAMLLVLGSEKLYFARFLLPCVPALLVEASLALDALLAWRLSPGIAVGALVLLPTLSDSVRFDNLLTRTDTRTLASAWLSERDATVAVDAAPLGPTLSAAHVIVAENALFETSLDEYRRKGVEYLVVSSFVSEARAVDPAREQQRVAFSSAVAQLPLAAEFRPYAGDSEPAFAYDEIYAPWSDLDRLERPGPHIWIYRLTP